MTSSQLLEQDAIEAAAATRIRIASQAFRYGNYDDNAAQTRTLRLNGKPLQFVVNTICDEALKDKEVEITVEIRDRTTNRALFETFWITTLNHLKQQSAFLFTDLPDELRRLEPGRTYNYHANVLVSDTYEATERTTRATVR